MEFDSDTKIWSGAKEDRNGDNLSFRETVLDAIRSTPEKVFQISDDEDTTLTYAETAAISIRIAQNLKRFGVQSNDVVAVLVNNSTYLAPIVIGCVMIGAPVNSVMSKTGVDVSSIKGVFDVTKPKVVIIEECEKFYNHVTEAVRTSELNCKIFVMNSDHQNLKENVFNFSELLMKADNEDNFELSVSDGIDDSSTVFIVPSSGTTGIPKSISLNGHYCKNLKYVWNIQDDLVIFSYSSISWLSGVISLVSALLINRATRIVTNEKFSPKSFGEIVKKYKVTTSICSTQVATELLGSITFDSNDFKSIKEMFLGGERVPSAAREFMKSNFPTGSFNVAYGTTECGLLSKLEGKFDSSRINANVVGIANTNGQIKIVDVSSRQPLGVKEAGEVLAKTETMFSGYYGNTQMTDKAFEKDNWYKTSDIGFIDENGFLFVYGRLADMLTVKGKKIHPAELESFFESIDGVIVACAINVADENIVVVLVTKTTTATITKEILNRKAAEKFGGGICIFIVDEIPRSKTLTGKIDRNNAKELALNLMEQKIGH